MKVKTPPRMSTIQWFVSIAAGLAMFLLPQDAQSYFSDTKLQSAKLNSVTILKQLYEQAQTLRQSAESLQAVLRNQNNIELLNKALDAGQISVIEYFTEVSTLYQSRETLLQLEKDYRTATAQIYRYEL